MSEMHADSDQVEDALYGEISDDALERASWEGVVAPGASCQRTDTSGSIGCGQACC